MICISYVQVEKLYLCVSNHVRNNVAGSAEHQLLFRFTIQESIDIISKNKKCWVASGKNHIITPKPGQTSVAGRQGERDSIEGVSHGSTAELADEMCSLFASV